MSTNEIVENRYFLKSTCASLSRNSWSSFLLFSCLSSSCLSQVNFLLNCKEILSGPPISKTFVDWRKFTDFVEEYQLPLQSSVSGLFAFVFVSVIHTYWSVNSCFASIFFLVFIACHSNEIAYFFPYRPLSCTGQ